ncbi:hypothetical protein PJK52_18105 [Mycobacterium kansasii]|uniref:hypothetical protein n=1 Tax=Mycobacterium kansasii TaxID=1768 RepID=UPI000F037EF9|nr:hypothetical protein [Mycobacterium kansasii]VAZ69157.1 hypothetical protein LAUMK40_05313 [Mycobacterium kansasii]
MELLYVVEVDVRPSEGSDLTPMDVRDRVKRHLAEWLSFEHTPTLDPRAFDTDGTTTLISGQEGKGDSRVSWSTEGTAEVTALVVTVRTEITRSGRADFICVVTVFTEANKTAVRLELGRESLDGVLAPTGIDYFRRPYLLVLLLRDGDLRCWCGPSRVDGRFEWVNSQHADFVWEALSSDARLLPILLVDGSDEGGEQLARKAAGELIGLAPVLAVDARSQRILSDRLDQVDASIPRGGARLVWPELSLRHPLFAADQAQFAPGRLLRMLSSVSVTVRGVNQLLRTAEAARRAARSEQIAADLAAAKSQGNNSIELEAQARVIDELQDEISQYDSWFRQVEDERDQYKAQAAQAAYWRQEAERARQSSRVRVTDWAEAPELDPSDLASLASYLEKQAQGAIVFTRDAHQSWKRDAYPHVRVMRDALIALTKAAIEYRRLGCQLGMLPDDWFKHEWELNLASTDQYMSRQRLDTFDFDGKTHSRLPHLKLGDSTSPNEVGRVYFAMDSEGERFIVDHVGLKLYGL